MALGSRRFSQWRPPSRWQTIFAKWLSPGIGARRTGRRIRLALRRRWSYDAGAARKLVTLSAPDQDLMRRFNRWRAPRWVRWWMLLATRAGDGWLWGLIGIAVLLSPDRACGFARSKPRRAR